MPKYTINPVTMIPTFMKDPEHMNELMFVKTVEMGNYGIKFVDYVFFLIGRERSVGNTNCICPAEKAFVWTGQPTCKRNYKLPFRVVTSGTRYWKVVDNEEVDIDLDEAQCIPIEWDRIEHTEQKCLVFLIAARPHEIWPLVGNKHLDWS